MLWFDYCGGYIGYVNVGEQSSLMYGSIENWTGLKDATTYDNEDTGQRARDIIGAYDGALPYYGGGFTDYFWKADSMDFFEALFGGDVEKAEMEFSIARGILTTCYWRLNVMRKGSGTNPSSTRTDMVSGWDLRTINL